MRTIENKATALPDNMDYAKLIKICVNVPPKEGFSVEEMKKRIRILDVLDKDPIEIEDADFSILKQCVTQFRWGVLNKEIIAFVDYIQELKENNA